MNITRLFRNIFQRNKKPHPYRRPFWQRLPPLQLPRFRLKLPRVSAPEIKLPSVKNPFANLPFRVDDQQGFFIILNWLGYVLLFASAVDYFLIIYPPQLTNPQWELQTMGRMVEHAWVGLIALILIFLPTRTKVRRFELNALSFLRWFALLMGIVFILLIPLGLVNSQRIDERTSEQIAQEQQQRQEQLNNIEEAVQTQEIPPEQLQQLGEALGVEGEPSEATIREALLEQIEQERQQLRQQVAAARSDRLQELIRQAVRTNIGALLIGVFLIRLWWEARWVGTVRLYSQNQ
ncbi:MAG: HpsJ family protein [Halothece sp.]